MKRMLSVAGAAAVLLLLAPRTGSATPTGTYWTPMSPDIQGYGVLHIGVDNYTSVFREAKDGAGDFPTDMGLTLGVLPAEKIHLEVGVDLLEPSDDPLYFNARLAVPEGALFAGSPVIQAGVFNVGTESDVTDQNTLYGSLSHALPSVGRLSVGGYVGNDAILVNADGEKENSGFLLSFDRGFLPNLGGEFSRVVVGADYASGKNALGGGGLGINYYFTKDVSILTGPVWFNEEAINGKWKWTVQLDVNQLIFGGTD